LAPGHRGHLFPQFLSGGPTVLYYVAGESDIQGTYVDRLDGTSPQKVLDIPRSRVVYASTGLLLFIRENALFAQGLDPASLQLTGNELRVADSVAIEGRSIDVAAVSASNTGAIIYRPAVTGPGHQLTWFDRSGEPLRQVGTPDSATATSTLSVSRDGRQLALTRRADGNTDVWILDLERGGVMSPFTFDAATDGWGLWSHDDMRLTFASNRSGGLAIYEKAFGTRSEEPILVPNHNAVPADWSPDGGHLLYVNADPETHLDIWALPAGQPEKRFPLVQSAKEDLNPHFSPNGAWFAYQSDLSSRHEVYVQPFGRTGSAIPISIDGGTQPRWRRDGQELFYLGLDGRLMSVEIAWSSDQRSFDAGIPARLFQTEIGGPGLSQRQYEVSPDGQRFLMNAPIEGRLAPMVLIQNWLGVVNE
jgi:hypothetical protein